MVCLPLLLAVVCLLGSASARPPRPTLPDWQDLDLNSAEASARSERSANISHIVGTSRKIQLIVSKSWYLQIHPDGVVNGTDIAIDSDYTILQRVSVSQLQITIQGVATCQFLCMDSCGLLYGSRQYTDDCLFNEMIEAHHFNTYSSVKYSNDKRTFYLGLTKKGMPRKVQTKADAPLGRLAAFTNVLTKHVPKTRVEELAIRMMRGRFLPPRLPVHPMLRHHSHHQLCAYLPLPDPIDVTQLRCHRQKKKKKRKCGDDENEDCEPSRLTSSDNKKCEDGEEEEECQRRLHMIRKKRKSRTGEADFPQTGLIDDDALSRRKRLKLEKKRLSGDKARKRKVKCLTISKSDEQAYSDCVIKKGLRKKLRGEQGLKTAQTTVPPSEDDATEPLLWMNQLGRRMLPNTGENWARSAAMPN